MRLPRPFKYEFPLVRLLLLGALAELGRKGGDSPFVQLSELLDVDKARITNGVKALEEVFGEGIQEMTYRRTGHLTAKGRALAGVGLVLDYWISEITRPNCDFELIRKELNSHLHELNSLDADHFQVRPDEQTEDLPEYF